MAAHLVGRGARRDGGGDAPDRDRERPRGGGFCRHDHLGDWLAIATPHGRVRARARLNASLADGIVAARHGWWQACPELELPGYDALDPDGANINLAIGVDAVDPVSGAAPLRCYPCEISKLYD
jgi:Molydopterin dinucleotide binding domain